MEPRRSGRFWLGLLFSLGLLGISVSGGAAGQGVVASAQCVGDANGDGAVGIDELLKAVNNALKGCPTPVPTPPTTLEVTGETQVDLIQGQCPSTSPTSTEPFDSFFRVVGTFVNPTREDFTLDSVTVSLPGSGIPDSTVGFHDAYSRFIPGPSGVCEGQRSETSCGLCKGSCVNPPPRCIGSGSPPALGEPCFSFVDCPYGWSCGWVTSRCGTDAQRRCDSDADCPGSRCIDREIPFLISLNEVKNRVPPGMHTVNATFVLTKVSDPTAGHLTLSGSYLATFGNFNKCP